MLCLKTDRFRNKEYERQKKIALAHGVNSLNYNLILKTRAKLNNSKFKSEMWFIDLLKKHLKQKVTFHRNYPILNRFFADFAIKEIKFIIEIDGSSHIGKEEYDKKRDSLIAAAGYRILRCNYNDETSALSAIELINKSLIKILNNINDHEVKKRSARKEKRFFGTSEFKKVQRNKKRAVDSWAKAGLDVEKIKSWYNIK